ncbi:MAG: ice-binding family protein [Actinomycetota bacterium]|nr:ice-binding family protein [Actinomycetota bacterium]
MAEHRVSMLSASLRRFEDPARSSDPRIRSLVGQLASLEPAPAPRAHFRAELRAQLVAVAPRLIAEGVTIEARRPAATASKPLHAAKPARSRLAPAAGWTSRISVARPLSVATAVIAVFAMLLGGAVWVSKKALPGDALYSLKRANENLALALTTGDTAKGHEYLKLAQTRAEEVSALVSRTSSMGAGSGASAAGGVNAHTAKLITDTLDSADSDTRSGAKLLDAKAVSSGSAAPLAIMIGWAPGQVDRLTAIASRLGAGPLPDRVIDSARVAAQAYARAIGLQSKLGCNCLDNAPTDEFGPMPCTDCSAAAVPTQQPTTPSTPGAPRHSSAPKGGHTVPVPGGGRSTTTNGGQVTLPVTLPANPSRPSVPPVSGGGGVTISVPSVYSVLTGSNVVSTGISALSGDLGVSPGSSYTGFAPGTVAGTIHAGDRYAAQALSDFHDGYNDAASRTPSSEFAGDQNGKTFHKGVHHAAAAFTLTGTLTLDAQGDPNAVFIFQVNAALNTAASSTVALVNGAKAANVFWQVNGAANTGANSAFAGTIMAKGAITLGDSAHLAGRALSDGTVTLANDTITAN